MMKEVERGSSFHLAEDNPSYVDDWCVVMLIQGVCFKFLARYDEAERCFGGIIGRFGNLLCLLSLLLVLLVFPWKSKRIPREQFLSVISSSLIHGISAMYTTHIGSD